MSGRAGEGRGRQRAEHVERIVGGLTEPLLWWRDPEPIRYFHSELTVCHGRGQCDRLWCRHGEGRHKDRPSRAQAVPVIIPQVVPMANRNDWADGSHE